MLDQIATLIPGLAPWTIVLAILVCFVAALFGGMSGFGTGLIITLFLTMTVGAKSVIPMGAVIMFITNFTRIWLLRSSVDLRTTLIVAAAALPMTVIGANVFVRMDSDLIQTLIGFVLVFSVPARRWLAAKKITPSTTGIVVVGGTYGFLSAVVAGSGMLIIPLLMGSGLLGATLIATDAAIAALVNFTKAVMFGGLDALSLPMVVVSVVMGIVMIPGTWLAAWIVRNTQVRIHTLFVEGVIVVGAIGMIAAALV